MGSISIRRYIRWPPGPPQEPTSTIVLTSPARRFVDLRILDPTPAEAAAATVLLPTTRLDWAIAGTSESWTRTTEAGDNSDMFPQPGGTETLEKGRMVNPATGREADYEELWADEEPTAIPLLPGGGNGGGTGGSRCVVLRLDDPGRGARGLVVLLGRYCQGLIRVGEGLGVERWQWREEEGWGAAARIGTVPVPCEQIIGRLSELLEVGKELREGVNVWEVVEHA
ncbi:hypothetical protein MAPG_08134 [Magnaporthiopsis poae ATCC 64411]|uniref:Protein HRI1 n=1 Tax=Magnaporthiopsis poae (strain ATCC 64411 / 73-15) TaxID=644358 RepID=A0A0C4E6J2_MAGP6|nr:hypothetical protein MAPG_08134 [Magnaporthiopsis poae ATCC 64411]